MVLGLFGWAPTAAAPATEEDAAPALAAASKDVKDVDAGWFMTEELALSTERARAPFTGKKHKRGTAEVWEVLYRLTPLFFFTKNINPLFVIHPLLLGLILREPLRPLVVFHVRVDGHDQSTHGRADRALDAVHAPGLRAGGRGDGRGGEGLESAVSYSDLGAEVCRPRPRPFGAQLALRSMSNSRASIMFSKISVIRETERGRLRAYVPEFVYQDPERSFICSFTSSTHHFVHLPVRLLAPPTTPFIYQFVYDAATALANELRSFVLNSGSRLINGVHFFLRFQ
jgi:hypothetical protein